MQITNQSVIEDWSSISDEMINKFGDQGDFSRIHLLNPTIFALIADVASKQILDAGCGQGYLSRMLAKRGAIVTAIEPSQKLIEHAIAQEKKDPLGINYIIEDLSVWQPFENKFDIVIANMVFMDIPEYQSAIKNCIQSLKSGGMIVFSIIHPCFEESVDWTNKQEVTTKEYFVEAAIKQNFGYFFHRTISTYLNFIINNGCQISKLVEPQLSPEIALQSKNLERSLHVPSFLIVQAIKVL